MPNMLVPDKSGHYKQMFDAPPLWDSPQTLIKKLINYFNEIYLQYSNIHKLYINFSQSKYHTLV